MASINNLEETIFEAADELTDPAQRRAFLDAACADDLPMRQRIEDLFRAQADAEKFFLEGASALELAGKVILATTERPGDLIGHYKLVQKIGEGGCGVVYQAEQEEPVRRQVALKVIKLGMDTQSVIARFEAERQALALMDHQNIAKVLDAGATDTGRPFFVMELVPGAKITDFCDQHHLSTQARLGLFIQVCQAIQHAHQKGIIHRDIKPSNILVTASDGRAVPKVIDFGIAKAIAGRLTDQTIFTALEQFLGTPAYMSPEQAAMASGDIDTRSDIYSLGVLLYELLTGKTPFDTDQLLRAGVDEMRRTICHKEPVRPSTRLSTMLEGELADIAKHHQSEAARVAHLCRGDLDWIVMKALEKDRTRRYETANGFAKDIQRHLNQEPVVARPPTTAYKFRKFVRRNQAAVCAVAVIAIVLLLGICVSTWQAVRATRAEVEMTQELAREHVANGMSLADDGDLFGSLSWFANAMKLNAASPDREKMDRFRILAVLERCPTLVQVWFHDGPVNYTEFSHDGNRVVTASSDGTARVWDRASSKPVGFPLRHGDHVCTARFSPDDRWIVTASYDGTARVWDAATGKPVTESLKHGNRVLDAEFSPDGHLVATASMDNTAQVWAIASGRAIGLPLRHSNIVCHVEFSPDGSKVITASHDWTARVWNAASGQPISPPLRHGYMVAHATFHPDGRRVLTSSADYTARIWDVTTGLPVIPPLSHKLWVDFSAFSPDGEKIITASRDGTARIWSSNTGQPMSRPLKHGAFVTHAAFSHDGLLVATSGLDRTVRIWDTLSGNPVNPPLTHIKEVTRVAFSPDDRYVLSASGDGTARVSDLAAPEPVMPALKHVNTVVWKGVGFSPDGRQLVTADGNGTVHLWNAETGQLLRKLPSHEGWMCSVAFSPDGERIVSAGIDHTAIISSVLTGESITLRHGDRVLQARFSPDARRVVTASFDGTARQWDARTGKEIGPAMQQRQPLRDVNYSHDGTRLVTGAGLTDGPGEAQVWDSRTGQRVGPALPHAGYVESACFSPDGDRVLTGCNDGTARVWNATTGQPLIRAIRHRGSVRMASFSPDGRRILTASEDGTARVWDSITGQALVPPLKHGGEVATAVFSSDGRMIATASHDHTVRLWDAATGDPLTPPFKHEDGTSCVAFSPDDRRVVTGSGDRLARIWELPRANRTLPSLLTLAPLLAGQAPDRTGGFVASEARPFREAWEKIQRSYSSEFAASPKQVLAWHSRKADECESAGQWGSAVLHLDQLSKAEPGNQRLLDRRARALGERDHHRVYPPRDPHARPDMIDLSNYYNAELTEDWPLRIPGNDLSSLPRGLQAFGGVTFEIRGIIQLSSDGLRRQLQNSVSQYPEQVSGIAIHRKCQRVHALLGAIDSAPAGTQIGSLILHYTTGYALTIPLIFGEHVGEFWSPINPAQETERAVVVWTGFNAASRQASKSLRLYTPSWDNPVPGVELTSIDFKSAMDLPAPFMVALTVE